jgi:SAM-dependent methyltransferase
VTHSTGAPGTGEVEGTQRAYAAIAGHYADRWDARGNNWLEEPMTRLAAELPTGALVADVGCGPGNDTVRLRGLGLRAHGFDLSHAMLTARGVPGQVRADLRALPLRDGVLDGLWCVAVLLHIPRELVPGALAEFRRVLRPGGSAVITVAEGDGEGGSGTRSWRACRTGTSSTTPARRSRICSRPRASRSCGLAVRARIGTG